MERKEGRLAVCGGRIWYEAEGSDAGEMLLVIHGGPGYPHYYLEPLAALRSDRPVVFYDQLGCGKSDRVEDDSLWQIPRFADELKLLVEHLGPERVHLFGHSWGTIIAVEYALLCPEKTASLILASPCLSIPRWAADTEKLVRRLPGAVRRTIERCEKNGECFRGEYLEAIRNYNSRFVCSLDPRPAPLQIADKEAGAAPYLHMWGPSEFYVTGTLKSYDRTAALEKIAAPVLFTCGRFDEARPGTTAAYARRMPNARTVFFRRSSHMPHWEEQHGYLQAMKKFLRQVETGQARRPGRTRRIMTALQAWIEER